MKIVIIASLLWMAQAASARPELLIVRTSLDQATRQVIDQGAYRVLGAQTVTIENREVHVIKVLTPDGRIQHIKIDAETGAVIG